MKITEKRLKEIIKEEVASLDEKNYYPSGRFGSSQVQHGQRERTPEEREHDRRERERQNQDYAHRYGKKPFGSRGTHLEEEDTTAHDRRNALVEPRGLSWRAEDDTMSVGADIEGYPEPEEDEDPMASRLGTREEQLLSRILARAVVDKYDSYEDLANDLGLELDIRMLGWLRSLKANPMYGSSGVEEGKVSSHRSEVTYSKEKRGKSKKPEKKAYNKADRAQAKRDLKK